MSNPRITEDYSARIGIDGYPDGVLVNSRYDRIDMFRWLSHAIIRVVMEEGVAHIHIDEATGDKVQDATGLPMIEWDTMIDTDYNVYLKAQETRLEDWL